jgi:hypothetical protein
MPKGSCKSVVRAAGAKFVLILGRYLKEFNSAIVGHSISEGPEWDAAGPTVQDVNEGMTAGIQFQSDVPRVQTQ